MDKLAMNFVIGKTGLIAHKNTSSGNLMICVPYSDIEDVRNDYGAVFVHIKGKKDVHVSSDVSSDYQNLQIALRKFYGIEN